MTRVKFPSLKGRGFTLLELMTTLAVLALLVVAAAPSLAEFHRNAVLTNTTNTLVSSIYRTRSEAMKEGKFAIMIPGGDEGATDHSDWKNGWMIFIDNNLNRKFDTGDDVVFRQPSKDFPEYIEFDKNGPTLADGTTPAVMFNGSGFSRTKDSGFGAMTIEVRRNDVPDNRKIEYTRRIKLAETGRLRTCRPASATDTKCPGIPATPSGGGGGGSGG